MAIIKRYKFKSFYQASVPTPAGLVEDGGYSTYTLDSPDISQVGTSDFLGVIQDVYLLGELVEDTLDTGRFYSINDINNMTLEQFFTEIALRQRLILNPQSPTAEPRGIGWVVINKSRSSFYYRECATLPDKVGKRPHSEHYFDTEGFYFDPILVTGPGPNALGFNNIGPQAITPNLFAANQLDPNIANNLGIIAPKYYGMGINEYFRQVIDLNRVLDWDGNFDERWIGTLPTPFRTRAGNQRPIYTQLLMATIEEHFNNPYTNPLSDGKWGRIRTNIQRAVRADESQFVFLPDSFRKSAGYDASELNLYTNLGPCIPSGSIGPGGGGDDGGGDDILEEDYDLFLSDPDTSPDLPFTELNEFIINCGPIEVVSGSQKLSSYQTGIISGSNSTSRNFEQNQVDDARVHTRLFEQSHLSDDGIRDPREISYDSIDLPKGTVKLVYNCKTCTSFVYLNLRDKDGDVPEPVGPIVTNYIEKSRQNMYEKFNIDYVSEPILKEIGCGTDNLVQYSDGNSFKELLGESVFGCGDLISLISIPEVFVEMYNKNEYQETKKYRREIERPSSLPDWLGDLLNERVHDQAHINDLVQDLTIGIPDQDYILGKTITYDNWLRWEDWEISYPDDEWSEKDERKLISRWKSMIRPLFLKTMTSNYRMPAYDDSTTLGNTDYRNFSIRGTSNVPLSPTIYDRIDNAVSLKVDDNTVNNDNSIQSGFNVWNFILDRIVQTYSSTLQIPGTDIDIFIPNIAAIQKTYELIETLIIDPSKIDWKNVSKDVLIESIKMVIIYILGKIITDLETVNPSRYSLKPLRVFKSGGVILESRSGLYTTPHEPCPIIFLGFNDGMQINEKIENLSKTDEIHSLYYTDPKTKSKISIGENLDLVNRGLIVRTNQGVLQNTFILPGSLTNISVGSADVEPEIKDPFLEMGIYSRPIMNRRIKKYGINPLLDVFYLNMKPAEKSKHPYARKVPFGWDKEQLFVDEQPQSYIPDNIWPEFTWGQYPSIFPPLWNDFVRSTDLPDLEDFNLKPGAVWGDRAWSRRTPNTILEIEKRWETYLLPLPENEFSNMEKSPEQIEYNSINPNNDIVVFKDKTPILDLYFMLMEMHVRGFSWAEILNYVKQIKGCVTKVQARKGKSNWFMDLDRLEEIFLTVSTTLSMTLISDDLPSEATAFNGVFTTPMIIWGMKKDLSESDISGTQLPSSDYMQYMTVLNRTDKNLLIESIKIETIPGNSNDIIGNSGKDFFFLKEIPNGFIGSPDKSSFLNINKEVLGPISIPPVRSDQNNNKIYDFRDMFTMPVYFLPDMAVHSHEYTARIVLKGNIGGEEYDESIIISGTPMKKLDIGTSKELEEDPFFIPNDIYFPNLAKESNFISGINYYSTRKPRNQQTGKRAKTYTIEYIKLSNMSDYFDIIIEEMEFKTQYAYGKFEYRAATLTSGAPYVIEPFDKPPYYNQPPYNTEVPFFKFIEYDENGREKLLEQKKILLNKRLSASTFDTLDELIKQGKTIMYEQHVAFTPIYEDKIYVTNIDVTYSIVMNVSGLGDIFDSNNRFKKSIKLVGNFINPN